MRWRPSSFPTFPATLLTCVLACLLLAGCGMTDRGGGGASDGESAWKMATNDPLSQPVQVAWTSARAHRCGYIFQPGQLRANFLNRQRQMGTGAAQMTRIQEAYDYTYDSVSERIEKDATYCNNKARTDAIRNDLQQYLAGNFAHRATPAD